MRIAITVICLALLMSTVAVAETITADFEGGFNLGDWAFHNHSEGINPTGGNPGGWYFTSFQFIFAPVFQCAHGAPFFTGDYTQMGVTRISGDFRTDYCENPGAEGAYPLTVLLRNNGGTPDDVGDDYYVYADPSANVIPWIGEGWKHYDFDIPSDFTGAPGELPAGWMGGSVATGFFPADVTFQDLMANVTGVEFWWMDPSWYAITVAWDAGADNITIETSTPPVATEGMNWGEVKALFR